MATRDALNCPSASFIGHHLCMDHGGRVGGRGFGVGRPNGARDSSNRVVGIRECASFSAEVLCVFQSVNDYFRTRNYF